MNIVQGLSYTSIVKIYISKMSEFCFGLAN